MRRQLVPALLMVVVMTALVGLAYPLVVLGAAQGLFHGKANGSLVEVNGEPVGSALLGQVFTQPRYFHPRPSAAGAGGYDAMASGGSNLGPTNDTLLKDQVPSRVAAYRAENGLAGSVTVPVDAVTASASGLDPDISLDNARLQAPRVARERGIPVDRVNTVIDAHTSGRDLVVLGEPRVNVLDLNLALDRGEG